MDFKKVFEEFQDYLAPKLDTYEQAIYLYALRHTRLKGLTQATIPIGSSTKKMAFGIGKMGTPMAEQQCSKKLESLQKKGCVKILGKPRQGTILQVNLPEEIPGVIPLPSLFQTPSLEEMDFYSDPIGRKSILMREANKCFYCFRDLDADNSVLDHVKPRANGTNGFRNLVASCRECNSKKNDKPVEDFLRDRYRSRLLTEDELKARLTAIADLQDGKLIPRIGSGVDSP